MDDARLPITSHPWRTAAAVLMLGALLLSGCSRVGTNVSADPTSLPAVTPATLRVTTTALPSGTAGVAYSATLSAAGGTAPYTWTLVSGALPAGLTLNATTGAIAGSPAPASGDQLTFQVSDSGTPAQTSTVNLMLSVTASGGGLNITTTSLPNGRMGVVYAASLAATGGTTPYTWSLTAGALPAGLLLNASTGAITGTPTAAVSGASLTFKVTDSGSPGQSMTVNLTLNVSSNVITIAVSPRAAALTVNQTLNVSATTNDPAGVTWTLTPAGGSVSPATSVSGAQVTVTAPGTAGVYTLTARSVTDNTRIGSIAVGVTDLPGVFTWHNDVARDGVNAREFALTKGNVNTASFGKLFSCPVDGAVYAQPLWVANLSVGGAKHNVLFAATEHDSLYAFDADANSCAQLWKVSLIDAAHGATSGEAAVPAGLVGMNLGSIAPEVGVTGTPVIDSATGILYVVSKSVDSTSTKFYQRLHAIDLGSGNEKSGSPVVIAGSYAGTGDGGSTVTFSARQQLQRTGLALVNGIVYIGWGSHEDQTPWYGWVMGYRYTGSALSQTAVLNVSPNAQQSGIWMSGAAPAADSAGHIYLTTGNGRFDVTNTTTPNNDYGDSLLQLTAGLTPARYFTPSDQASLNANDWDLGAGGPVVLNLPSGTPQHLVIAGGKDGYLRLLDGDNLGGYGDNYALQSFSVGARVFGAGALWNNTYYVAGIPGLQAYAFNPTSNRLTTIPVSQSPTTYLFPGSTPAVSASGSSNGIVWALNNAQYCTPQNTQGCGPAVLHAYDATNLATELWNSSLLAADAAGNAVKFTVPTVANGKVYVGTRGNNTGSGFSGSPNAPGELDVYGLIAK